MLQSHRTVRVPAGLAVFFISLAVLLPTAAPAAERAALEEIVGTAQKREEAYLDVPVSVNTITGEVLDIAQTDDFQDLAAISPSITYTRSGGMRGDGVLIRGIGTTAFQSGVEPTVSTVVDGVVLGRTGSFLSDLVDIERVEVLRGPQGTLFGKNASAGVVNVITKRPTEEAEAMIRVKGTSDDQQTIEALISGRLTDTINGRLTVYGKQFEGFVDNQFTGETINGDDSYGARGKLDIALSDRASLLLIGDYSEQERDCCAFTPRNVGAIPQFNPLLGVDLAGVPVGEANNNVLLNTPILSDMNQAGLSAEFTYDFDSFTFTSITAWRNWKISTEQDVDSMPFGEPTYGRLLITSNGGNTEQDQYSQEFQISSTAWSDLTLTAGAFFWVQDLDRYFQRELQICAAPGFDPALPPDTACGFGLTQFGFFNTSVDTTNAAVFGQADWTFAPDWTATFGLRYTYDDLEFDFDRPTGPIAFPAVPAATFDGGDDDTDLSGKAALRWQASNQWMFFGSYTRGYKSQGFDIIFGMTPDRAQPVDPETSDAFELGAKAELFDNRLRLGVTAFHTTFDDFQGQAFDDTEGAFVLTSAGSVITRGVELDITALPVPNLFLTGGVAYTDAFYDDFPNGPCWTGQSAAEGCVGGVQDLEDGDVPNSPDLKFTLQGRYDIELGAPFDAFVSSAYRWQDDVNSAVNQRPSLDIDSYGVWDLTLGLESDDGAWEASIFAKNLLDDEYTNIVIETVFDSVSGTSQFLDRDFRRYLGATVTWRYGAY